MFLHQVNFITAFFLLENTILLCIILLFYRFDIEQIFITTLICELALNYSRKNERKITRHMKIFAVSKPNMLKKKKQNTSKCVLPYNLLQFRAYFTSIRLCSSLIVK